MITRYYQPYRMRIERWIAARIARGRRVVHVAVHSFTPVLDGVARRADIGLLYDPGRGSETALCRRWRDALREAGGNSLSVRRNYPYRGASDGFTRHLRARFPVSRYTGVELEINQNRLRGDRARERLSALLAATLCRALRE